MEFIQNCIVFICLVLSFGMDHIKNLRVKYIKILLHYNLWLYNLKGIYKKVVFVEAINKLFRTIYVYVCIGMGVGVLL